MVGRPTLKGTILLVHDSNGFFVAQEWLERAGYRVLKARSFKEAVPIIQKEHLLAVVSDFQLPGRMFADDLIPSIWDHNKRTGTRSGLVIETGATNIDARAYATHRGMTVELAPDDAREVKKHSLKIRHSPIPVLLRQGANDGKLHEAVVAFIEEKVLGKPQGKPR